MSNIIEYTCQNCPPNVYMGKGSYCYGQFRGAGNKVTIGSFCSIAQNTVLDCGFTHDVKMVSSFPFRNRFPHTCSNVKSNCAPKGDINIGNDVTIGEGCFIMAGVSVGDGSIIGCNSVVTKNIGDYEVWGGSPAKFIKLKFPLLIISKLKSIAWWNWDPEKILDNAHLLNGEEGDVYKFIEMHYEG